jgi:hypothetical protein
VNDELRLAPHQCAALVAPAIDRLFVAGMAASRAGGGPELTQRYGGRAAIGYLIDFRTRLAAPGGVVDAAGFAAVNRYRDPVQCQRALDKQVAHGTVHRRADGSFEATDRGRAYLTDLYALHQVVTGQLWGERGERVARLVETLGELLSAATASGGPAFGTMAPPYEPDGTAPEVLLLNRLGTLRYHRADAHAAAWTAAGHTAQSITLLRPGPERLAIEQETDRRAAEPYEVLSPEQRLAFLADLAALPG